ncbi:DUF1588 domain-containing protein [Myxococcota bacterium]|nr:DUF1588 domain-containing protein [Myxococcota bacterium]
MRQTGLAAHAAALLAALLILGGCDEETHRDDPATDGGEIDAQSPCVDDLTFFEEAVMGGVLEPLCQRCHRAGGQAASTDFVLASSAEASALTTNFERVKAIAALERDGVSVLLLKPSGQISHEGGMVIDQPSAEHDALSEMIRRFKTPTVCVAGQAPGVEGPASKLKLLDPEATARKAALQLAGRLPTEAEIARAETDLAGLIAAYTREEAFYEILKRGFNDVLLTDKYLGGNSATSLLDGEDYPGRFYYQALDEETAAGALAQQHANDSVARGPLELIAHVVREGRPFSEILTADYLLVNPFSAPVYGLDIAFDDPTDPTAWREARIPGLPHAGILTSPILLNRLPTTDTNRNRHRARMIWQFFLATDILKLAERPVSTDAQRQHNPTMNNPDCTICHIPLDPIAGAFMNWDHKGRYRPPEGGWHADMRPPGFSEAEPVPGEAWGASLPWLAARIAADERFATATIHLIFERLIGRAPLSAPSDPADPRFEAKMSAYREERGLIEGVTARFVEADLDLRAGIAAIIDSHLYRATGVEGATAAELAALEALGTAKLLSPEALEAKLIATLGYPWKRRGVDRSRLTHKWELLFFYGGIDSDQITRRAAAPDGLMANVATRMAYEMGCLVPPRDFARPAAQRRLFPLVEATYAPEDDNGFIVPSAEEAIRANIRHLHRHLLDEALTPGDPLEEISWALFLETWREGYAGVRDGSISDQLPYHCRYQRDFETDEALAEGAKLSHDPYYTVRAWGAVLSALLSDWRFLYRR